MVALVIGALSEGAFEAQFRVQSVRVLRRSSGEVLFERALPPGEVERLVEDWRQLDGDAFASRWLQDPAEHSEGR